jgi:hypothetical protein
MAKPFNFLRRFELSKQKLDEHNTKQLYLHYEHSDFNSVENIISNWNNNSTIDHFQYHDGNLSCLVMLEC